MNTLIDSLSSKTPSAFTKFTSSIVNTDLLNTKNTGTDYVTRQIACICGNKLLHLKTVQKKELRGVCSKSIFTSVAPPIYVVCSTCQRTTLLFDPVIHGWNGELERIPDQDSALSLYRFRESPGNIYVQYSYRNPEKYSAIRDNGVEDIENYFDSFTLLYSDSRGEHINELFSQACI